MTAFSESVQAELMRLDEGESVCIQGAFKVELYQPEGGEPKASLSIIADNVLALRQPKMVPLIRASVSLRRPRKTRARVKSVLPAHGRRAAGRMTTFPSVRHD